jgi:hypothetical protein
MKTKNNRNAKTAAVRSNASRVAEKKARPAAAPKSKQKKELTPLAEYTRLVRRISRAASGKREPVNAAKLDERIAKLQERIAKLEAKKAGLKTGESLDAMRARAAELAKQIGLA